MARSALTLMAGILVLAAGLVAAQVAGAATIVSSWSDTYRDYANGFSVEGDDTDNRIRIALDSDRTAFLLSASGPVVEEDEAVCALLAPGSWRCRHAIDGDTTVDVLGRAGRDRIRVGGGVERGVYVEGGGDRDTIVAGNSADRLLGRNGGDVVRGGKGDDVLGAIRDYELDRGRDKFRGGAGNDLIRAADRERDRRVRCGPGKDIAIIDKNLDLRPRGCELVDRI